MKRLLTIRVMLLMALPIVATAAAKADSVEDFYRGKTITVISTGSVSSIYDLSSRLVVKYMAKHLPGDPSTIAKVMTGAGHLVGTNHLHNVAPRDGTTLGAVGETIPLIQVLQPEKAKYDVAKFNWLGNPVINNLTIVSWHTGGITSIKQVFDKELIIGTGGPGSTSTRIRARSTICSAQNLKLFPVFRAPR